MKKNHLQDHLTRKQAIGVTLAMFVIAGIASARLIPHSHTQTGHTIQDTGLGTET